MSLARGGRWLVIVVAGLLLATPGGARGEAILVGSDLAASLSGFVYSDITNNAVFESFERPILGVKIVLEGVQVDGELVSLSTLTGVSGRFLFEDLEPGTYSLTEVKPERYVQGKPNAVGSAGGEPVGSDGYSGIILTAGLAATDYNFGEYGLKAKYISKKPFLYVVPEPSVFALLGTGVLALLVWLRRRPAAQ